MIARLLCSAALLMNVMPSGIAQEKQHSNEVPIVNVVQRYFDAWKRGDLALMRTAIHPNARIYNQAKDGSLKELPISKGFRTFAHVNSNEIALSAAMRLVSVDVTGNVGFAKIEMIHSANHQDVRIVEYLTLMRFNDGWRIISKVRSTQEDTATSK